MLAWSQYSVLASLLLVTVSLVGYISVMFAAHGSVASQVKAKVPVGAGVGSASVLDAPPEPAQTGVTRSPVDSGRAKRGSLVGYATVLARLSLVTLTVALVLRAIVTGHGPFANQYEFSIAFAWGILAAYVYFEYAYHARTISLVVLPIAAAMLLYAMTVGAKVDPLVPALQNNLLLTVHVALAIIAYGAFSVACAAGVLYLIQPEGGRRFLPKPEVLDEIAYRAVVIAFPLMTLVIILGAVWANVAWGTYWSWDPKETASLLTWLIYGAYLHARVVHGWRGRRASWLLMLGFAAVLFTFFGNLFFGGLHSYGATGANM